LTYCSGFISLPFIQT